MANQLPHPSPLVAPIPKLALTSAELGEALGISERTVRTWAGNRLPKPTIDRGRVKRWSVAHIQQWLAAGAPDAETCQQDPMHLEPINTTARKLNRLTNLANTQ